MRRKTALLSLALILFFSFSFADEVGEQAAKVSANFGNAVVWVKFKQPYEDWDGTVLESDVTSIGVFCSDKGDLVIRGHIHLMDFVPTSFRVLYPDGTEEEAEYLGKDSSLNVAFARIKSKRNDFRFVDLSKHSSPALGSKLFVLTRRPTWDNHAISIKEGRLVSVVPGLKSAYLLEGLGFGNLSGSPVFAEDGGFMGVIGFDLYQSEGGNPSSFPGYPLLYTAAQLLKARPVLTEKSKNIDFIPGWTGIIPFAVDEKLSRENGLDGKKGLFIASIIPQSPASEANLHVFDVILAIDGVSFEGDSGRILSDFSALVRQKGANQKVLLTVFCADPADGKRKPVEKTLLLKPEPPDSSNAKRKELRKLGFTARELTWDYHLYRNYSWQKSGVVVDRVVSGTSANLAELQPEDVIVSFNHNQITSLQDISQSVEEFCGGKNKKTVVEVNRGGRRLFLILELFTVEKEN